MDTNTHIQIIKAKYRGIAPLLNERARRCWAAGEAAAIGWGGTSIVARAIRIDPKTIRVGLREIMEKKQKISPDRIRGSGGGRMALTVLDPGLERALLRLVDGHTRGDPMSPLRWVSKSTRILARELAKKKHPASHTTVSELLKAKDYTMQQNQKVKEGLSHPDRNAQFQHISDTARDYLKATLPVISVDTKKKELVGNFKNNGKTWLPKGKPIEVETHDFPDPKLGKANPFGVYDIGKDQGYVRVGITHDTSEFAVASIRGWWKHLGKKQYAKTKKIFITADSGGSNGYRLKLWKKELQRFADESKLAIEVSHFPPGTSKWNKIEHKLFSFITINWRGRPLTSYAVIVKLIGATTTESGLKVYAVLDTKNYRLQKKVTDKEFKTFNIIPNAFHGEWNYTIKPRGKKY